jgi:periplasmic copper chaperone A
MFHSFRRLQLHVPLAALTLLAAPAFGHEFKAGELMIDHPWIRATPPAAKTAGGYLKITNHGKAADTLTGGSAKGAKTVEVHQMTMDDNVMKMRELKGGLEIKPGETVELKPGSYHLMLMGLSGPFKEGEAIDGTLVFEKAGKVDLEFKVEPAQGKADGHSGQGHDGGHKTH